MLAFAPLTYLQDDFDRTGLTRSAVLLYFTLRCARRRTSSRVQGTAISSCACIVQDFGNVVCLMCWFWFGPAAAGLGLLALGDLLTNSSVHEEHKRFTLVCIAAGAVVAMIYRQRSPHLWPRRRGSRIGSTFCIRHCALRHLLVRQSYRQTNLKVCLVRSSSAYLRQFFPKMFLSACKTRIPRCQRCHATEHVSPGLNDNILRNLNSFVPPRRTLWWVSSWWLSCLSSLRHEQQ